MPKHALKATWTKVASVGDNADILNSGKTTVEIAKSALAGAGQPLVLDGRHSVLELRTDLYARSLLPGGEVITTISPGRLPEYVG